MRLTPKPSIKKPTPKRRPPFILPSGKKPFEQLTKEELEGAAAWRHGLFYKLWIYPFGSSDLYTVSKPPEGVRIVKGVGSAYKSVIAKGVIPSEISALRMGIVNVGVTRTGKGKPRLHFTKPRAASMRL